MVDGIKKKYRHVPSQLQAQSLVVQRGLSQRPNASLALVPTSTTSLVMDPSNTNSTIDSSIPVDMSGKVKTLADIVVIAPEVERALASGATFAQSFVEHLVHIMCRNLHENGRAVYTNQKKYDFLRQALDKHGMLSGERFAVVDVEADGNCFFRSVSLSLFGHELLHAVLRVVCAWQLNKPFLRDYYTALVKSHEQSIPDLDRFMTLVRSLGHSGWGRPLCGKAITDALNVTGIIFGSEANMIDSYTIVNELSVEQPVCRPYILIHSGMHYFGVIAIEATAQPKRYPYLNILPHDSSLLSRYVGENAPVHAFMPPLPWERRAASSSSPPPQKGASPAPGQAQSDRLTISVD